jgi:flagellar biosynthesis GTPase FlhF
VTSSRRIKSERVRHRRKKESKSKLLESGDSSPAVVVSLADIEQAPDLRDTLFCEEDLVKEVSAISATQAEASEKHKEDKEREKRERKEREKKEKEKEKQEKKERKEKEKEKKKAKTKKGDEDGEADKEKSSKSSFSEDSSSSGSEDSKEKKKKKKKTFLYPLHPYVFFLCPPHAISARLSFLSLGFKSLFPLALSPPTTLTPTQRTFHREPSRPRHLQACRNSHLLYQRSHCQRNFNHGAKLRPLYARAHSSVQRSHGTKNR